MATKKKEVYPASLEIDYPEKLDRLSSFFRILWAVPILIILSLISQGGEFSYTNELGQKIVSQGRDVLTGLSIATGLMILFQQRYPKWWFNFSLELSRFSTRVMAYVFLLTDKYPSTEDEQSVHLNIAYPNVKKDLNRWLPPFKWLLVFPHYIVLAFLMLGAFFATVIAFFSVLFTGKYPKSLFNYVVGVFRWMIRVSAYAFLLTTDQYPPFSLN